MSKALVNDATGKAGRHKSWPARYADLDALYTIAREDTDRIKGLWEDAKTENKVLSEQVRSSDRARQEAEANAKELRERLDELKGSYADARYALARLTGYLDRVYEDDVVRDPVIEVANQDQNPAIRRTQPKRPRPMRDFGLDPPRQGTDTATLDRFTTKSRRPDHWAKY